MSKWRWRFVNGVNLGAAAVFVIGSLLLLMVWTPRAVADNTTCPNAIMLVADGTEGIYSITAAGQLRWFRFTGFANRSYVIAVENTTPTDVMCCLVVDPPVTVCGGAAIPAADRSQQEPPSVNLAYTLGAQRLGFKPTATADLFFNVHPVTGTGSFRVRVQETTLTSPLWSTFGGFETFYRFNNFTNQSVSVTLRLVNDGGAVLVNTTFALAAGATSPTRHTGPADFGISDNQAGQTIITHDGAPGAIHVDGFLGNFSGPTSVVLPVKIETRWQGR